MDLSSVVDFVNQADTEIGKYRFEIAISPSKLSNNAFVLAGLNWQSIKYGDAEIDQVPSDKRGIYAFSISYPSQILPPHGYILYIGIAGRRSDRSLKARYKDYLNPQKIIKRERIARMIANWQDVLRFHFAPVEDAITSDQLEELETQLNTALLPPFSEGDLEADTKRKRRAFR
ncbi:hypothetical protein [Variovorax sp. WS11]|uniref:hypothetical protein n=1 Tax=Variovorax sp. WS11 TaxID=1105204 RepID=UPI0011B27B1E|nr:hypothetical protein [Variovorax sp. WS11]NDZ17782.1 hypothetical protein [Variovorax sp. WS11]